MIFYVFMGAVMVMVMKCRDEVMMIIIIVIRQ